MMLVMLGASIIPVTATPLWKQWAEQWQNVDYHEIVNVTPVPTPTNNGNAGDIWLPRFNESFFNSGLCQGLFVMPVNPVRDLCPWAYTVVNYPVF